MVIYLNTMETLITVLTELFTISQKKAEEMSMTMALLKSRHHQSIQIFSEKILLTLKTKKIIFSQKMNKIHGLNMILVTENFALHITQ